MIPNFLHPSFQSHPYLDQGGVADSHGKASPQVTHDWLGDLAFVFSQDRAQKWPKGQGPEGGEADVQQLF